MAKKKKPATAETRRTKILAFLEKHPDKKYFIADLNKDLNFKDEPTLRRDLENLADQGYLNKEKDKSQVPVRSLYQFKATAAKANTAASPSKAAASKKEKSNSKKTTASKSTKGKPSKTAATKANPTKAAAPAAKSSSKKTAASKTVAPKATVKAATKKPSTRKATAKPAAKPTASVANNKTEGGRRSARQLEADILNLLATQKLTAGAISEGLGRQRPTVVKALERMLQRRQLKRVKVSRSFLYYPYGEAPPAAASAPAPKKPAAAATKAPKATKPAKAAKASVAAPVKAAAPAPMANADEVSLAVRVAVEALMDRVIASERRVWELERK